MVRIEIYEGVWSGNLLFFVWGRGTRLPVWSCDYGSMRRKLETDLGRLIWDRWSPERDNVDEYPGTGSREAMIELYREVSREARLSSFERADRGWRLTFDNNAAVDEENWGPAMRSVFDW